MPVETPSPSPIESGNLSREDIVDLLAEPAEGTTEGEAEGAPEVEPTSGKKPPKPIKIEGEGEEEELEVEGEEELEEELPPVEELELTTPVRRKEILAKYPNLFKDFPYLQQAYYREQHFTEIFPTLDDAKEAAGKANALDGFEADLMQGNIHKVLGAIKQQDPEGFNRLADNYLQELSKVDKDAVHHVIGNVIKNSVINVITAANESGNEALKEAAFLFHQAIFGTAKISAPTNLSKRVEGEQDPEKIKLAAERAEFTKQRFEAARDNLNGKVQNSIKSTIANHIDPKASMTDYVRKNAIRDAHENLENLMGQDKRFSQLMDTLWRKAFDDNFSTKSIEQIRSTYLSKAKTLLPSVIQKHRNEALRTGSKTSKEEKDRKGPLPVGRHSQTQSGSSAKSPAQIPKGMKTLDFLNSD